jgi:hypothetical protein
MKPCRNTVLHHLLQAREEGKEGVQKEGRTEVNIEGGFLF